VPLAFWTTCAQTRVIRTAEKIDYCFRHTHENPVFPGRTEFWKIHKVLPDQNLSVGELVGLLLNYLCWTGDTRSSTAELSSTVRQP
jgi:hypothetical protein